MLDLDLVESRQKPFIAEVAMPRYAAVVQGALDAVNNVQLPAGAGDPTFVGFSVYEVTSDKTGLATPVLIDDGITLVIAHAAFPAGSYLAIAANDGSVGALAVPGAAQNLVEGPLAIVANQATPAKTARALLSVTVLAATGMGGPFKQFAAAVPAANAVALGAQADGLSAVDVLAATGATGAYKIMPAGTAPAAGQCALNAGRNAVEFNAADAVTSVTIDALMSLYSRVGQLQIMPRGQAPTVGCAALSADGTKINVNAADVITSVEIEYLQVNAPASAVAYSLGAAAEEGDLVPALIIRTLIPSLS